MLGQDGGGGLRPAFPTLSPDGPHPCGSPVLRGQGHSKDPRQGGTPAPLASCNSAVTPPPPDLGPWGGPATS